MLEDDEIYEIVSEMYKLSKRFVEKTGLNDPELNGDYETPKMPDIAKEWDHDILSDIYCIYGDCQYF
jgi:hypothetical protein